MVVTQHSAIHAVADYLRCLFLQTAALASPKPSSSSVDGSGTGAPVTVSVEVSISTPQLSPTATWIGMLQSRRDGSKAKILVVRSPPAPGV